MPGNYFRLNNDLYISEVMKLNITLRGDIFKAKARMNRAEKLSK